MIKIYKAFLILLLFFLSSTNLLANENFIVAKVNNSAITNIELEDRYNFIVKTAKIKVKDQEEKQVILSQILDKIIDEELIRQDAKKYNISNTDEEVNEAVEILAIKNRQNVANLRNSFLQNGFSYQNYLSQISSEILWSKIIGNVIKPRIKVSEFEVKEFLEQQKYNIKFQKFDISEIVISNKRRNSEILANKLYSELENGSNFQNLVRQFSNGYNANQDGKIGWVYKSDIDPKIYNAIKDLKINGYTSPVVLSDGFHIFKLNDVRSEIKIPEQVKETAKNAIFSRKLQTASKAYLINLRKKSYIEISY